MERIYKEQESMVARSHKTLAEAPLGTFTNVPGMGARIITLGDKLGLVRATAVIQAEDIKGTAIEKQNRRVAMEGFTMFVAKKTASLAYDTNNPVLFEKVNITESYLSKLPTFDCWSVCKDIYNVALPYLLDLGPYGVTVVDFDNVIDSADSFLAYKDEPRDDINERKAATDAIPVLLGECEELLVGADLAIGGIEGSNPEFFKKYFKSREIVNTGGRVLSLRGETKTEAGVPLKGVKIVIEGTNVVKKSTDKGNFQVRHLEPGIYTVVGTKEGYEQFKVSVAISANERSEVSLVMKFAMVVV